MPSSFCHQADHPKHCDKQHLISNQRSGQEPTLDLLLPSAGTKEPLSFPGIPACAGAWDAGHEGADLTLELEQMPALYLPFPLVHKYKNIGISLGHVISPAACT